MSATPIFDELCRRHGATPVPDCAPRTGVRSNGTFDADGYHWSWFERGDGQGGGDDDALAGAAHGHGAHHRR